MNPEEFPPPSLDSSIPAAKERVKNLQKIGEEAIACHNLAMQRMADRTFSRKFEPWKPGDKVWLSGSHLLTHYPSRKLAPKNYGPFTIESALSPITFKLRLPNSWKIHPVFHASELSSYRETEIHGPNYPEPPPDIIGGEEEYEIEAILAHKGNIKGRCRFLVTWEGYSILENLWYREKELKNAQEVIKSYKTRLKISRLLTQ